MGIEKDKLSIVSTQNENAVQIMTIHKSKGLQFPVVIVPYDLYLYHQKDVFVWHQQIPKEFNFDKFLVPPSNDLAFSSEYGKELYDENRSKLELDQINLTYVAYTRAVEQLYIITEYKGVNKTLGDYSTDYTSGILIKYLQIQNKWQNDVYKYEFGAPKRESTLKNEPIKTQILADFSFDSWQSKNIQIVANSERLWDYNVSKALQMGTIIHQILSKIYDDSQIDSLVKTTIIKDILIKMML